MEIKAKKLEWDELQSANLADKSFGFYIESDVSGYILHFGDERVDEFATLDDAKNASQKLANEFIKRVAEVVK